MLINSLAHMWIDSLHEKWLMLYYWCELIYKLFQENIGIDSLFKGKNSLQMWIDPLNTLGKHVNWFTLFFLDKYYCLDFMFIIQARLMKHGFVRIKGNGFLNVVTDQDQYLYKMKANIDIKIEFHWIRLSQRNWRPNDSRVNG